MTGFFFPELGVEILKSHQESITPRHQGDSQVTRAVTLWGLQITFSDLKWGFSGGKKKIWASQMPNMFESRLGLCCCHHMAAALGSQAGTGRHRAGTEPSWLLNSAENTQNLPRPWRNGEIYLLLWVKSVQIPNCNWGSQLELPSSPLPAVTYICDKYMLSPQKNPHQNKGQSNQN